MVKKHERKADDTPTTGLAFGSNPSSAIASGSLDYHIV